MPRIIEGNAGDFIDSRSIRCDRTHVGGVSSLSGLFYAIFLSTLDA